MRPFAAVAVLLAACGFTPLGGDGGADANPGDGPTGADLAGSDGALAAACPRPLLAIAIGNQTGDLGGIVHRVPLGAMATPCLPLFAEGKIPTYIESVAIMPSSGIAVGAGDGTVRLIDERSDTNVWVYATPTSLAPVDVFPIVNAGNTYVGAGWAAPTVGVTHVQLFLDGSGPAIDRVITGATDPHDVFALAPSPLSSGRAFALEQATAPEGAVDYDPFAQTVATYVAYPGTADLKHLATANRPSTVRVIWPDANGSVYWSRTMTGAPSAQGPSSLCAGECLALDAAPDPTDDDAFFAVCKDAQGASPNWVTRFTMSAPAACTDVYRPAITDQTWPLRVTTASP